MLGVYIHIPFCESKCHYCAFSSFVKGDDEKERYIKSLVDEMQTFAKTDKRKIDTIYIGGGTPSMLTISQMERIVNAVREGFDLQELKEFTIEANPCSITEEKLKFYKSIGVNRISLGVQSLDNNQLKMIGRRHDSFQAIEKIKLATSIFENVSCDMLIGLPHMEKESFLRQIEYLTLNNVKHISAYMLQVERGTPLAETVSKNPRFLPDDDESVDAYSEMAKLLEKRGFIRYEVSNFAQKGYESRHNYKYWTGEEYVGFGLGAHSYLNGQRVANASTFEEYYDRKLAQREVLTTEQKLEEHIMLGLRCSAGINKKYLNELGYNIDAVGEFQEFKERGILFEEGDIVRLNPDFYGVSNYIIVKLIP